MEDTIPCEHCGLQIPVSRYAGHSLLCALTSADARLLGPSLFSLPGLGGGGTSSAGSDYESNLRLQDAMGGPVRKACRDINEAAPVVTDHTLERCPVCLCDTDGASRVRRGARCSHEFCAECLEKWLSENTTCPMCVSDLSENGGSRYVIDDPSPEPAPRRWADRVGVTRDDSSLSMFTPVSLYAPTRSSVIAGLVDPQTHLPSMPPSSLRLRAPRPTTIMIPTVAEPSMRPLRPPPPPPPARFFPRAPPAPPAPPPDDLRNTRDLLFHIRQVRDIIEGAREGSEAVTPRAWPASEPGQ